MKIVVGISDDSAENRRTLAFLSALGMSTAQIELFAVVERFLFLEPSPSTADIPPEPEDFYWRQRHAFVTEALNLSKVFLEEQGVACTTRISEGLVANEILERCRQTKADLLVLGTSEKGKSRD